MPDTRTKLFALAGVTEVRMQGYPQLGIVDWRVRIRSERLESDGAIEDALYLLAEATDAWSTRVIARGPSWTWLGAEVRTAKQIPLF